MHSTLEPLTTYKENDEDLSFLKQNLKSLAWLLLVTTELTFIEDLERSSYWKLKSKRDGKIEVSFAPSDETWKWAANFLEIEIA